MKDLLILPFDHRSSFAKSLLKKDYKKLTAADKKKIRDLKYLIFEAFLKVFKQAKNKDEFAVLVDEEFGAKILKEAKKKKIKIILTTEKTSHSEYEFEYGKDFDKHIKKFKPDFVKALVRYNVDNKVVNERQLKKLKELSDFCEKNKYQFLLELLVPPTEKDLQKTINEKMFYCSQLRLKKTVIAIEEIKEKIHVDIWKLEGFLADRWQPIIKAVNKDSQIVVLGRGENKLKVVQWLTAAKSDEKIIGFAVGRTVFLNPLKEYLKKKKNKAETIQAMAQNFEFFVNLWQR